MEEDVLLLGADTGSLMLMFNLFLLGKDEKLINLFIPSMLLHGLGSVLDSHYKKK